MFKQEKSSWFGKFNRTVETKPECFNMQNVDIMLFFIQYNSYSKRPLLLEHRNKRGGGGVGVGGCMCVKGVGCV